MLGDCGSKLTSDSNQKLRVYYSSLVQFQFKNGFIRSFHHLYKINILEKTINTTSVSYDAGLMPLWMIVLMTHPRQFYNIHNTWS